MILRGQLKHPALLIKSLPIKIEANFTIKSLKVVRKSFVNSLIDKNSSIVHKNEKKLQTKVNFQISINQHLKFKINKLAKSQTHLNYVPHPKIKKT